MPSTLELCEKYYGTRDVYKLLDIEKDALERDVKKAYYKLSLQVHPDRVADDAKEEATEKFKILTKIHGVLIDPVKKALYDEQGILDDDDDGDLSNSSWLEMWRQFFKPITTTDIDNYLKEYQGSDTEKLDVRKAYLNHKGCMNYMMECVPFMSVEDEPRIIELINGWIAAGEVPAFKAFTDEPKPKRNRRHKKYAREALQAREIKREMEQKKQRQGGGLQELILARQADRASSANNFFDALLSKYGGGGRDDTEEYVFPSKKEKKAKKATTASKNKNGKGPENRVRSGRVTK